ncbi:MAG: cupin-like domain-containing protein [Pseudomonadota bacterium]
MSAAGLRERGRLTFEDGQEQSFGQGLSQCRHDFADSGLFSDEKLAELIDRYPREYYMITTTTQSTGGLEWHNGDLNGASGAFVLQAVREGRLWLCLRRLDLVAPEYEALVNGAFDDIEARNPNCASRRRTSSLLISSPGARVLYHADIPMVALWHVRGRKRFWLYDAENPEHLPDQVLEGVVLRESEEEIAYDPAWDAEARVIDLAPGDAVSWPQNAPHRVDNLDGLNVSITTDYFTPAAERKYGVYYANGLMRRLLGVEPRSTATRGPLALAKCVAALALKKLRIHRVQERDMLQSFLLDPHRPGDTVHLPREKWRPILQA